jgi:hypothetical protein
MNSYRTGIILLADVGLEFGLTKRCRKMVDEIMPQVRGFCFVPELESPRHCVWQIINGNDLEQRALACFTLARCIIVAEKSGECYYIQTHFVLDFFPTCLADGLREAVDYLLKAESDWKQLQMLRQLMDVQYLLSIVYHNLDMGIERDDAIKRYTSTEETQDRLDLADVDEEAQRIWEVVSDVAAGLASKWCILHELDLHGNSSSGEF